MSEKYTPRFFYKEKSNGQNEYLKKFAARVSLPDSNQSVSTSDVIQVRGVESPRL